MSCPPAAVSGQSKQLGMALAERLKAVSQLRKPAPRRIVPGMWQPTRRGFCATALALAAEISPARHALPSASSRGPGDEPYWNQVRGAFGLDRGLAYFNTASLGAP